jgi:hypothetical protein
MKKQHVLFLGLMLLSLGIIGTIGCKKESSDSTLTEELTNQQTNASDESRLAAANDETADDVNKVVSMHPRLRGFNFIGIYNGTFIPCNATIDSSLITQGRLTITYNGLNCNGTRSRTGTIIIQLPYDASTNTVTPWSAAGSSITITYNALVITSDHTGKSLTINGSHVITNVNGGLVDNSTSFATPILHRITGQMQLTFDNGSIRTWNVDRNRLIERTNNVTTITTSGNASQGGFSNVSVWGINRLGNTFYVTVDSPVILSSTCNYDAISGVRIHHGVVRELTVTYGVDQAGNAQTSGCPYGYRINWTDKNGNPRQAVISY